MLKFFTFYFLLFTFLGVSSNFNAQAEKNKTPILVTKIAKDNSEKSINFKYDGTKLIETENGDLRSIYTYTGNLITQIRDYNDSDLIKTADFTYFKDGKLKGIKTIGVRESYGPYTEDYYFTYPTPSSIVCTEFELYDNYEDKKPHKMTTHYTLKNGNIILQKNRSYEGESVEFEILKSFTYDHKNNPYNNILGYDKIWAYISEAYDEFAIPKNNLTSYKLFQNVGDLGSTANFTIKYNADNFPEKIVSKYYNRDGILYENMINTYSYTH